MLDRLLSDADLAPALDKVRARLRQGATGFGGDAAVLAVLGQLGGDLRDLHIEAEALPHFRKRGGRQA